MTEPNTFYVDHVGQVDGPFTRKELTERLATGQISYQSQIWDGRRWRSARAFGAGTPFGWILLLVPLLALPLVLIFAAESCAAYLPGRDKNMATFALIGVAVAFACLYVWRLMLSARPTLGFRLVGTIGALLSVLLSMAHGIALSRAIRWADREIGTHELVRVAPGHLILRNAMGRTLDGDLEQLMATSDGDLLLELNSHGGVLEAANRAAELVRAHGAVTTRVVGQCSSACVLVFGASAHRQMHFAGTLGFHQPDNPEFGSLGLDDALDDYLDAIEDAGFSDRVKQAIRTTPSTELTAFSPVLHYEDMPPGLEITDDDGHVLDQNAATFAYLAWSTGVEGDTVVAEGLRLVSQGYPEDAHAWAQSIRDMLIAEEREPLAEEIERFLRTMAHRSRPIASPRVMRRSLVLATEILREGLESEADVCDRPVGDRLTQAMNSYVEVLRSAAERDWIPAPHAEERRFNEFIAGVRRNRLFPSMPEDGTKALSQRALCQVQLAVFQEAAKLDDMELPRIMSRLSSPVQTDQHPLPD